MRMKKETYHVEVWKDAPFVITRVHSGDGGWWFDIETDNKKVMCRVSKKGRNISVSDVIKKKGYI